MQKRIRKTNSMKKAKQAERLYFPGMSYQDALRHVLGQEMLDAQIEWELDDFHRNNFYRQKGEI